MALSFLALVGIQVLLTVLSALLAPRPKLENAKADDQKPSRSQEGEPIPVAFGTVRVAANVTDIASTYARPDTQKVRTGLFSSKRQTVGHTYEMVMQTLVCHGPVDELLDIVMDNTRSMTELDDRTNYGTIVDGEIVQWGPSTIQAPRAIPTPPILRPVNGESSRLAVESPNLFQGKRQGGGVEGILEFYWGTQEQTVNLALQGIHSTPEIPYDTRFQGLCYAVFGDWDSVNLKPWRFDFGENSQLHEVHFLVRRCPSNLGLAAATTNIGGGANPAEMVWEVLTNYVWGLGIPEDTMDRQSFIDCAEVLATEAFGLNMLLGDLAQADETIQEIMRYIDGQLQQNPVTGLLELSLNRADYVVPELTLLNQTVVSDVVFTRPSWQALKNEVKVVWSKREGPIIREVPTQPVQDLASQRTFGQIASETVNFGAVSDAVLANQLAVRTLRMIATPLGKLTFRVNRLAADFRIGRPFRFTYPEFSLTERIYRVASVDFGTLEDGVIDVEAVEDVFSLEDPFYFQPEDTFVPVSTPGAKSTLIRVEEIISSTGIEGHLLLVVDDPEGQILRVEFQTQVGDGAPSGWFANVDPGGFQTSVSKVAGEVSIIAWRIIGIVDGEEVVLLDGEEPFVSTMAAVPQAIIRMLSLLAGEDPNHRARFEIEAIGAGNVTLWYRTRPTEAYVEAPTNPYALTIDREVGEVTAREIEVRAESDTGEFDHAGPVIWDWDSLPGVRVPAPAPWLDATGLQVGWEQTASADDDTRGLLITATGDLGSVTGADIVLSTLGGGQYWAIVSTQKTLTLRILQDPGRRGTLTLTPYRNSTEASRGIAGVPLAQKLERPPVTSYSWVTEGKSRMFQLRVEPADAEILHRIIVTGLEDWISETGPISIFPVDVSSSPKTVEFYSRVPGGGPAEIKRQIRLDKDAAPDFDWLSATEVRNNVVQTDFSGHDEDCARWALWGKVGSFPVMAGEGTTETQEPDSKYLKDQGSMERRPREFHAINGNWYLIGRAYGRGGKSDYIERRLPGTDTENEPMLVVTGAVGPQPELSTFDVSLIGDAHRVTWNHSAEVGSTHRVVVLEHEGGDTREVVTLAAGRTPAIDAGTNTDSGVGTGGVDVVVAIGGTITKKFDYEVQLYDGSRHLRSYTISIEGSVYGEAVEPPPPSSPVTLVLFGGVGPEVDTMRITWVNTATEAIELDIQWRDAGVWKQWMSRTNIAGTVEDFVPYAFLPASGSLVRFYARYSTPSGPGPWSPVSNVFTIP